MVVNGTRSTLSVLLRSASNLFAMRNFIWHHILTSCPHWHSQSEYVKLLMSFALHIGFDSKQHTLTHEHEHTQRLTHPQCAVIAKRKNDVCFSKLTLFNGCQTSYFVVSALEKALIESYLARRICKTPRIFTPAKPIPATQNVSTLRIRMRCVVIAIAIAIAISWYNKHLKFARFCLKSISGTSFGGCGSAEIRCECRFSPDDQLHRDLYYFIAKSSASLTSSGGEQQKHSDNLNKYNSRWHSFQSNLAMVCVVLLHTFSHHFTIQFQIISLALSWAELSRFWQCQWARSQSLGNVSSCIKTPQRKLCIGLSSHK